MRVTPLLLTGLLIAGLAAPAEGLASAKSNLYKQVAEELRGQSESCLMMSQSYQDLFSEAGRALGGEASCAGGVEALYLVRRQASGRYFKKQTRRQLKAVRRGVVKETETGLRVKIAYRGTPPGWTWRARSRTRENFELIRGDGVWLTDTVETVVRPPLARPTPQD